MSLIVDTHCHLSGEYNDEEIINILDEAKLSGVGLFFDVGYDLSSSEKIYHNVLEHDNVYGIVGIHPDNAKKTKDKDLKRIEKIAGSNSKIVGIGEIGLDYYHMVASEEEQKAFFIKQLRIAKKLKLAVSIHIRDKKGVYNAYEDCYDILVKEKITRGTMHCYSGTYELAKKFIKLGFYISFSGIVTFKNAKMIHEIAKRISITNILTETDSPYLAPEPYRGTKNYPKFVTYVVKKIAILKSLPIQELVEQINKNTKELFRIEK